jgi:hypothetical protein
LAHGDSQDHWRQLPFQFNIGGNIWHPPQIIKYEVDDEEINNHEKSIISKNKNIYSEIQNHTINYVIPKVEIKSEVIKDEDEEESVEVKSSHVGLVKLDNHKLNKFSKILDNLSLRR